jgi:hypothetical protein
MLDKIVFRRMALRTEGEILFPRSKTLQILYDNLVSDQALFEDLLDIILKRRYLQPRRTPKTRDEFDLEKLFNMPDADFQQAARTTKAGFMQVLDEICMNPVFLCRSIRPQLPIPHQLALTLERLGSNGNGASLGRFSRNLNVGQGTVVKVTRRVLKAILSLGRRYVSWPDAAQRAQISEVMADKGFPGCVGFIDGTTIPLFQRPGFDGEVFYDRKRQYSINAQIVCDCNKYITSFITGWPGSCGDSRVYKRMQLHQNPSKFFDEGTYLVILGRYLLIKISLFLFRSISFGGLGIQIDKDSCTCLQVACFQPSTQLRLQFLPCKGKGTKRTHNWCAQITMELLERDAIASLSAIRHARVCCVVILLYNTAQHACATGGSVGQ